MAEAASPPNEVQGSLAERQPAMATSAVNQLFRLSSTPDQTSPEPFITALEFSSTALVIKAGLGRGKTSALVLHLRDHPYDGILVASPRRSYGYAMHERFSRECPHIPFQRYDALRRGIDDPTLFASLRASIACDGHATVWWCSMRPRASYISSPLRLRTGTSTC